MQFHSVQYILTKYKQNVLSQEKNILQPLATSQQQLKKELCYNGSASLKEVTSIFYKNAFSRTVLN